MDIQIIASGSSGNCCRVSDGKTELLIDAGIPINEINKALNFNLHSIEGMLLTHEHCDHSKAVHKIIKSGINVYSSAGTFEALGISGHRAKTVKALVPFEVGTFKITPLETVHDAAEPLGYLIISRETKESLLYFTDTSYFKYVVKNINYLCVECNYDEATLTENTENGGTNTSLAARNVKNHMGLGTLIDYINAVKCTELREIHILHISQNNVNAKLMKSEIQAIAGVPVYTH